MALFDPYSNSPNGYNESLNRLIQQQQFDRYADLQRSGFGMAQSPQPPMIKPTPAPTNPLLLLLENDL